MQRSCTACLRSYAYAALITHKSCQFSYSSVLLSINHKSPSFSSCSPLSNSVYLFFASSTQQSSRLTLVSSRSLKNKSSAKAYNMNWLLENACWSCWRMRLARKRVSISSLQRQLTMFSSIRREIVSVSINSSRTPMKSMRVYSKSMRKILTWSWSKFVMSTFTKNTLPLPALISTSYYRFLWIAPMCKHLL